MFLNPAKYLAGNYTKGVLMKCELLLNDITQERFSVPNDLNELPCCVIICCVIQCCILDFSFSIDNKIKQLINIPPEDYKTMLSSIKEKYLNKGIIYRREKDYGLVWNAYSRKVYQLDNDAIDVLESIDKNVNIMDIIENRGIQLSDVQYLLQMIMS
jgi:hypothetical protein